MADIVISRLELYPNAEEATGYVVGFFRFNRKYEKFLY